MPIKAQSYQPGEKMWTNNLAVLKMAGGKNVSEVCYAHLLSLVAATLDEAGGGSPSWLSIGRNLDGTAFLVTYHGAGGRKLYAAGESLETVCHEIENLLQASEKL